MDKFIQVLTIGGLKLNTKAAVLETRTKELPFEKSRPLKVLDVSVRQPETNEVMIKILASGLCQSDISIIKGDINRPLPMVLGHEAAGIVQEVGKGVTEFKQGDKVITTFVPACGKCLACVEGRPALCENGVEANEKGELLTGSKCFSRNNQIVHSHVGVSAFSQYSTVSKKTLVKVNTDVPFEYLALFGCSVITGVGAVVNTAKIKLGQSICIIGVGGVGLSAIFGAKAAGSSDIYAIDVNRKKLNMVKKLDKDIQTYTPQEALKESIQTDIAIDTSGSSEALASSFYLIKRGGKLITTSLPSEERKIDIPIKSLTFDSKEIRGSYLGDCIPERDIPRFLKLYEKGLLRIDKLHSKTININDINRGFDDLLTGENIRIIVKF